MERIPDKPKASFSKRLKTLWKRAGRPDSLKVFLRNNKDDDEIIKKRDNWFYNKDANFSNLPLGLGRTRKRKNK